MLALTLIVWQALGLPEVEDPIPDKIGLGSVVGFAGAIGMLAGVLSVITRSRKHEQFVGIGTFIGLCIGIGFYALSLLEPISKRGFHPLSSEHLRHMWSTLGGVGGAIAL